MTSPTHIVFYDDACPMCNAEIEHYKKLKTLHSIQWLGIHSSWDEIKHYGLTKETLLRRIHAVKSDGEIVSGAAAFVLIWDSLKYYSILGQIVTTCRLLPILDWIYKYFAAWRYKKNQVCKVS